MAILGLVIVVLVVGVGFVVVTSLGSLKLSNRNLTNKATTASRAAGVAEQALASAIHNPMVDSQTANTLQLALADVRAALDRTKDQ